MPQLSLSLHVIRPNRFSILDNSSKGLACTPYTMSYRTLCAEKNVAIVLSARWTVIVSQLGTTTSTMSPLFQLDHHLLNSLLQDSMSTDTSDTATDRALEMFAVRRSGVSKYSRNLASSIPSASVLFSFRFIYLVI